MGFLKYVRAQWDRVAAAACVALGALALVAGWFGVSGSVYPAQQLPYVVSGGLAGILLVAVGATLWLSADLRDEWRTLDRIETALRAASADGAPAGSVAGDAGGDPGELEERVRVLVAAEVDAHLAARLDAGRNGHASRPRRTRAGT